MSVRAVLLLFLLAGCQVLDAPRPLPALDEAYFRCRVQPILVKQCGAFACHGDGRRSFRVFGRNRLRLGGTEAQRNAPLREDERAFDFASARAFVEPDRVEESLLLRKPLAIAAGGAFHRVQEIFAPDDVFATVEDPEYQVLLAWAGGATDDPSCIEPGSDL